MTSQFRGRVKRKLARRRSRAGEAAQPTAQTSGRDTRGMSDVGLAVQTASGPRRSKITPFSKGLFLLSIHGRPGPPWMPRANTLSPPEGWCKPSLPARDRKRLMCGGMRGWVLGCVEVVIHARSAGYAAFFAFGDAFGARTLGSAMRPPDPPRLRHGPTAPCWGSSPHRPRHASR